VRRDHQRDADAELLPLPERDAAPRMSLFPKGSKARVWSQSIARRTLLGEESQNPSLAARSLLGPRAVRRAEHVTRRMFGRRRRSPGNPLPAFASVLGGLGGFGRKVDPKKQGARLAAIRRQETAAIAGDKAAKAWLELIAAGREGAVAVNEVTVAEGRAALERVLAADEARAAKFLEQKTAAREAAAAATARETRFLEAGTSVAGALATAVGRRGGRRPVRRRRRSSYY